ncbi:RAB6A-GEF complex partner protein 2, partial [Geodia barretti]
QTISFVQLVLGERGSTILSTPTTVLVCNLSLQPGETKTVSYSEHVPEGGPPSFKGRLVKYMYKLAVGAQRPGCPAQISRIPFHVRTIPEHISRQCRATETRSENPFLTPEVSEDSAHDLALQALAMETSRRTSMNYTLKNPSGVIGRLSFFKPSFKVGEDVTGALDLCLATTSCLQISAELQSLEEVPLELQMSPSPRRPVCATHARYTECCPNTLITHFSLPVPLSATQSFSTNCVSLKWQVHFQFVLSRNSAHKSSGSSAQEEDSGSGAMATTIETLNSLLVDTMTWDLPVTVLPTVSQHSDERTTARKITI